jgi:hypothetical protein
MSENAETIRSADLHSRTESFFDCVAYVLAKRWLREQRQPVEKPAPSERSPGADRPEPQCPSDR